MMGFIHQWIEMCNQMSAYTVGIDQLEDFCLSLNLLDTACCAGYICGPRSRFIRDMKITKQVRIKILFAKKELMNVGQKLARFSSLDHPMIIGAGHRHD